MARNTNHEQHRTELMEGVIKAGAKYDLGGITNQTIAEMSDQAEPYIYRYFMDRDDLVEKTFFRSDKNFFGELTALLPLLFNSEKPLKERFVGYMNAAWDYMTKDFNYCKFYTRYFYSNANTEEFRREHIAIADRFFAKIKDFFQDETLARTVLHQTFLTVIWNVMDMAVGFSEDTPDTRAYLFDMMYSMILPTVKEEKNEKNR